MRAYCIVWSHNDTRAVVKTSPTGRVIFQFWKEVELHWVLNYGGRRHPFVAGAKESAQIEAFSLWNSLRNKTLSYAR